MGRANKSKAGGGRAAAGRQGAGGWVIITISRVGSAGWRPWLAERIWLGRNWSPVPSARELFARLLASPPLQSGPPSFSVWFADSA